MRDAGRTARFPPQDFHRSLGDLSPGDRGPFEHGRSGLAERSHLRRTALLARAIAAQAPAVGESFRCPYLRDRQARHAPGATCRPR
jgi:hypothetical protein